MWVLWVSLWLSSNACVWARASQAFASAACCCLLALSDAIFPSLRDLPPNGIETPALSETSLSAWSRVMPVLICQAGLLSACDSAISDEITRCFDAKIEKRGVFFNCALASSRERALGN